MSREIPFDKNAVCDSCGALGAFDYMGDYICPECAKKSNRLKEKVKKDEPNHQAKIN